MCGPAPWRLALSLLLSLSALLGPTLARAHGGVPEPRQILVPSDRPERIILVTNFGLIFSEDAGESWSFSCEQSLSAYAGPYLLGARPSNRIFTMTSGAGLIYSDDGSCSWKAAGGSLTDVLPFAFTVDPSNSKRAYVIGVPRQDLRAGDSIHISDDGGLTFGEPVFTAPERSALLTVLVAPSEPSTLFASMFSTPGNHPILLRSLDSGEHWEWFADLVDSLGTNPFELLAIDPFDATRIYVRILGPFAETLAISEDGGLTFVQSVSIPGKLNAFLKLASGTILVGGMAGTDALGYRSRDPSQGFEPWREVPHIHALAERNGKLYAATDNFADGYAIAESDDEGAHFRPLTGFEQVRSVKSCVVDLCAESCVYHAGIGLWPETACAAPSTPPDANNSAGGRTGSDAGAAGGCACRLIDSGSSDPSIVLLVLASMLAAGRRVYRPSAARVP
ncbi:MAG: hypothetical protein ABI895_00270 [Deltaproteobacteria bacterium]